MKDQLFIAVNYNTLKHAVPQCYNYTPVKLKPCLKDLLGVLCVRTLCWGVLVSLCIAQPWLRHPEIRVTGLLSAPRNVLDKVKFEKWGPCTCLLCCCTASNSKSADIQASFASLLNHQLCHCEPASVCAWCLGSVSGLLRTPLWEI